MSRRHPRDADFVEMGIGLPLTQQVNENNPVYQPPPNPQFNQGVVVTNEVTESDINEPKYKIIFENLSLALTQLTASQVWIDTRLEKAKEDHYYSQNQLDALVGKREARLNAAMQYEIAREWYYDWNPITRRATAKLFLQAQELKTPTELFRKLVDLNQVQPWASILSYSHGAFDLPINPATQDMRTSFYYEEEYPWVGYLVTSWWPTYGNTERYDLLRKNAFKNAIGTRNIAVPLKKDAEKTSDWFEKNANTFYFTGAAILGIAAVGASASLVSAVKK